MTTGVDPAARGGEPAAPGAATASADGAGGPPPLASLGIDPARDLWVFAYGSLMWDPGFAFVERHDALLAGYHRRFCIYSVHYRGTPAQPGLVLGLDNGGSCRGIAYRIAAGEVPAAVAYLWQREMISYAYRPVMAGARLIGADGHPGTAVPAWCFVVDHHHAQYCGERDPARLAARIRAGHGSKGSNRDYLAAAIAHLDALGIRDEPLHALAALVTGGGGRPDGS